MAARNKGASLINKTTVAITVGIFALLVFFLDINLFFAIDPDNNNLATPANPVQNDEKEVLYNIQQAGDLLSDAEAKAEALLAKADELEEAMAKAKNNNIESKPAASTPNPPNCPQPEYKPPTWSDMADPSGPQNMHLSNYADVRPEFSDRAEFLKNAASQSSEDIFSFDTFFKGKTNGVFLEMGALDGHKFSNTIKHDKYLKWRGVLIEPDPENYKTLTSTRAGQALFHAASCGECMQVSFARSRENAVGGIWEFMTDRFKRMWFPQGNTNSVPLTCMPLHSLLEIVKIKHVNFFSLDVEGAELEVIKGIDFSEFSFDVMVLERDNPKRADPDEETLSNTAEIVSILEKEGYRVYDDYKSDAGLASSHNRNIWIVK